MKPLYPTGSEYCLRLTGNLYNYSAKVMWQYKLAINSNDTRKKAEASKKVNELRRLMRRTHPEFFTFIKSVGCNAWTLEEKGKNIFLIAHTV